MSFFSKVKRGVRGATRVAARATLAPTSVASGIVGKVAPRPIARGFSRALNLTPTALVARKATALTRSPARGARAAPVSRGRVVPLAKPGGIFSRVSNAITQPTAAPSSGEMVAPSVVRAAAAVTSQDPGAFDEEANDDEETADYDDGGGYDDTDDGDGLEGINYEAALAGNGGLGDWTDELKNFGISAGKAVTSQALTTIANKLGPKAPAVPPPPAPMSMAAKIAIGAAIALPVGYLVLRRPRTA